MLIETDDFRRMTKEAVASGKLPLSQANLVIGLIDAFEEFTRETVEERRHTIDDLGILPAFREPNPNCPDCKGKGSGFSLRNIACPHCWRSV